MLTIQPFPKLAVLLVDFIESSAQRLSTIPLPVSHPLVGISQMRGIAYAIPDATSGRTQSDSIKNLDIRKVKNDKWDARRLALLYRIMGDALRTASVAVADWTALKDLIRQYYDVSDELTAHKLRLRSLVDRVLLSFEQDFFSIISSTGLAVLKAYPSAKAILQTRKTTLVNLIVRISRKGQQKAQLKYEALHKTAQAMLELGDPSEHLGLIIRSEITLIEDLQAVQEMILQAMQVLVDQNRKSEQPAMARTIDLLDSITGIGFVSAATLTAEFGDIASFKSAQSLTAFSGLDASVRQSGKFKGSRNKISKRGSRLIRRSLFHVASANIRTNKNNHPNNPYMQAF